MRNVTPGMYITIVLTQELCTLPLNWTFYFESNLEIHPANLPWLQQISWKEKMELKKGKNFMTERKKKILKKGKTKENEREGSEGTPGYMGSWVCSPHVPLKNAHGTKTLFCIHPNMSCSHFQTRWCHPTSIKYRVNRAETAPCSRGRGSMKQHTHDLLLISSKCQSSESFLFWQTEMDCICGWTTDYSLRSSTPTVLLKHATVKSMS